MRGGDRDNITANGFQETVQAYIPSTGSIEWSRSMPDLTRQGRERVAEIAECHGFSSGTAELLLDALARGGGSQAQFDEPELGGLGQWSRGGMVMVGDMFNHALKARVDALCCDLSELLDKGNLFEGISPSRAGLHAGYSHWPSDLGNPASSGSQNDMRYAVFPGKQRLAVAQGRTVTVYDTGEHRIGGVVQAQSADQSLSFISQLGPVRLSDLKIVGATAAAADDAGRSDRPVAPSSIEAGNQDVLSTIERLADLHKRGVLTDEEFSSKKAELLARL